MKKTMKFILILCVTFLCCTLFCCIKKVTFEDITIIGENVTGLDEGDYTLRYTIKNLDKYRDNNQAQINVVVTDKDNKTVPLSNNRIMQIEKDNEYLVTIMVTADNGNKTKTHNYTIKAIKSPITVTFTSAHNNFDNIIKSVPYGGNLTDIPDVPDYTPQQQDGFTVISTKQEWSTTNFFNLKENITVYADYGIDAIRNTYTITYQTFGGTEIPDDEVYYDYYILSPQPPQKQGFVFFGWYADEDFSDQFTFGKMPANDLNLYARWIEPIPDATDEKYFDFAITSYNPNGYMISAKNINDMPETVVIPNIYNGKPVIMLGDFAQCSQIKHLYIPETINEIKTYAFSGKPLLKNEVDMALETVTFAQTIGLVAIVENAFSYCQNLISINIPDSVKRIDKQAFHNCTSLTDVTFNDSSKLERILEEAFYNCQSLQSIVLPSQIKSLSQKAFYDCIALNEVYFYCPTPPIVQSLVFYYELDQDDQILQVTFYVLEDSYDSFSQNSVFEDYLIEIIQD